MNLWIEEKRGKKASEMDVDEMRQMQKVYMQQLHHWSQQQQKVLWSFNVGLHNAHSAVTMRYVTELRFVCGQNQNCIAAVFDSDED